MKKIGIITKIQKLSSKLKLVVLFMIASINVSELKAQIDTAFWFAAPWTTPDHWWKEDIVLHISTFSAPTTTVRIRQPAAIAPNKYDTVIFISAGSTFDLKFWRDKLASSTNLAFDSLEVRPANAVVPYGLYISSSELITVVYDAITRGSNYFNPETFSLKGQNALGYEFVCPQQTIYRNKTLPSSAPSDDINGDGFVTQPKQQINIVATQPNTVVWIKPRCAIIGHPANITYSVLLPSPGSAYTCENIVQNTYIPGNTLSGSIVVANKPIAVTVADDSVNSPFAPNSAPGYGSWGGLGCYDYIGDQIVPVDVVGSDYIVNRGQLYKAGEACTPCNGTNSAVPNPNNPGMKESAFIVATDNFTQLTINDGGSIITAILNKGDTYVDSLKQELTYIHANKNVYVYHVSGIGCELGAALLPPLSCAGSKLIAFSRNTPQRYALNVLCKNGSQGTFTLNGSTTSITATNFTMVPGTTTLSGGPFWGARISLNSTVTLPIGSYTIGNNSDEFALGVFDGDFGTGGLFHYMSAFLRKTVVTTGTLLPICAGQSGTVAVTGTVSGAAINGVWSTSVSSGTTTIQGGGTGTFSAVYSSSIGVISTVYSVSTSDTTGSAPTKTITLYLTSTGVCKNITDSVKLVINQRPVVTVSSGSLVCKNNILPVNLSGTVTNAFGGGVWTGGNGGIFGIPGPITSYTPSQADINSNLITFSLTSQVPLNGCPNSVTTLTVSFIDPALVTILPANKLVCSSATSVAITGSISGVTTTGNWLGGAGTFTPVSTSLSTTYLFGPGDYTQGNVTLTLTSTNNGICASESATLLITLVPEPILTVPSNFPPVCAGTGSVALSGTISSIVGQGTWLGAGTGSLVQGQQFGTITANYFLGALDIINGTVTFSLVSTGGVCPSDTSLLEVTILRAPMVQVNQNFIPVCENAPVVLSGTITGYTDTGIWSSSSTTSTPGSYSPAATALVGSYYPSAADISNGFVVLTLSSTNNGNCPPSSAAFTASFIPAPEADFINFGKKCTGSAVSFSSTTLENGTGSLSYLWNFGDQGSSSISTAQNPLKTYTISGQYVVTLTVTGVSQLGVFCPDTISKTILVKALPIADYTVGGACEDKDTPFTSRSFSPAGSDPIIWWEWTFGDIDSTNNRLIKNSGVTVYHSYADPGTYITALTVTAGVQGSDPSLGCVSETKFIKVDVNKKPHAEFGLTNNPTVVNEPIYFSDFSTPPENISTWYWQFGDEDASNEQTPTHTYLTPGLFEIKLTIIDKAGCLDIATKVIEVNLLPQLPTGFSPNNDGYNDVFIVKGGPFEKILFRVYNNWGQLLFESQDQKIGWDGKYNGVDQPAGVYVWTLIVDMYNNRQSKKNGDVTLIR